ncbi:alcohol dehydrogenase catalytic domain-containing protein [Maribius pontilimi]|uniref:Alcohol dehydrogenase catalytic domain-containing protein n=1 Tax=Palleronia pontilimi TaxID=1964209 RepID=A0A934IF24_9RHOB|nr:alcohol dehydrogenase catalytic domain-containing protein [Palleronia pontilimi]MBJ3761952.1 alcohol dehydrogenase catalytic domain-containing protein [Palleronia pontilimi]
MKALVYTGPEHLEMRDVADPAPGAGEIRVRVRSSGICGSDMHAFLGHDDRRPAPLTLGHEVAGTTDAGMRVTVNPLNACGQCPACLAGRDNLCPKRQIISMPPREGGFAEYITLPPVNAIAIPDAMHTDQAALAEPIACGWHAVRLALAAGGTGPALVIGGGAIGVGAALSLVAQGVSDVAIVEPSQARRDYLDARGFAMRAPDTLRAGDQFGVVIDAVGIAPTRAQASAHARPGGIIAHIGLGSSEGGLDIRRMTLQEITFIGTYTYTAPDFRATVAAMADGRLGPLDWTETRPLTEGARAFADIRAGKVAAPKIILKP